MHKRHICLYMLTLVTGFTVVVSACLIMIIVLLFFAGFDYSEDPETPWLCMPILVIGVYVVVYLIRFLITDPYGGSYEIDANGITTFIGFKRYHYPWDSIVDYGIVSIIVDTSRDRLFFVYFSNRNLTYLEKEPKKFQLETRKDFANIAYFQYSVKKLKGTMQFLPQQMAKKLQNEASTLYNTMSWFEKLYHR